MADCPRCKESLKGWATPVEATWLVFIAGVLGAILMLSMLMAIVAGYNGKCATKLSAGCFVGEMLKEKGF